MFSSSVRYNYTLKNRSQHISDLKSKQNHYDILIVGGGANGSGVALDAASRGLKCAVIDQFDFASGTSSRSTKLAHGGIRYFEQMAMLEGDPIQSYELLREALHERNYFMQTAPYLNKELNLLIPSDSWFKNNFWHYPGVLGYHLIYKKSLWKSNFRKSLAGPKIYNKDQVKKLFPEV
jgi:glycerol-3-phosphate dehydrogenase